jgi:uncharacterized protein with PIN domain
MSNILICVNKECKKYDEEQLYRKVRFIMKPNGLELNDKQCIYCGQHTLEVKKDEEEIPVKDKHIMSSLKHRVKAQLPRSYRGKLIDKPKVFSYPK